MILLIDNNDSFTYNVAELIKAATNIPLDIRRTKEIDITEIANYSHIILSPGAGIPDDFPIMKHILSVYDNQKSILGICLGHQAICEYYGAEIFNLDNVFHGIESEIDCDNTSILFHKIDNMTVGRYHSWSVKNTPAELRITAKDKNGTIMAIEHISKKVFGVQFHPESYITKGGVQIIKNFIYGVDK